MRTVSGGSSTLVPKLCVWECAHSCLTLCNLTDYSPLGSSVRGIFQATIMEWVALSSSRGSSQPRDWTHISFISCTGRWILYHCAIWEAPVPRLTRPKGRTSLVKERKKSSVWSSGESVVPAWCRLGNHEVVGNSAPAMTLSYRTSLPLINHLCSHWLRDPSRIVSIQLGSKSSQAGQRVKVLSSVPFLSQCLTCLLPSHPIISLFAVPGDRAGGATEVCEDGLTH